MPSQVGTQQQAAWCGFLACGLRELNSSTLKGKGHRSAGPGGCAVWQRQQCQAHISRTFITPHHTTCGECCTAYCMPCQLFQKLLGARKADQRWLHTPTGMEQTTGKHAMPCAAVLAAGRCCTPHIRRRGQQGRARQPELHMPAQQVPCAPRTTLCCVKPDVTGSAQTCPRKPCIQAHWPTPCAHHVWCKGRRQDMCLHRPCMRVCCACLCGSVQCRSPTTRPTA